MLKAKEECLRVRDSLTPEHSLSLLISIKWYIPPDVQFAFVKVNTFCMCRIYYCLSFAIKIYPYMYSYKYMWHISVLELLLYVDINVPVCDCIIKEYLYWDKESLNTKKFRLLFRYLVHKFTYIYSVKDTRLGNSLLTNVSK